MTAYEYQAIAKKARDAWPRLTTKAMKTIKEAYAEASRSVADAVAKAELGGLSELTTESLNEIQFQLKKATWAINSAIAEGAERLVENGINLQTKAGKDFLSDAVILSGVTELLTPAGISEMIVRINERLISDLVSRMGSGGYALKTAAGFEDDVMNLISAGLAQGLDPAKIAQQITRFVDTGKDGMLKAGVWGKLKPGTAEYLKRLPKDIDWRALRILRTELTQSLYSSAVSQGQWNPGATGEYEWLRGNETDWGCSCPEYAAGSPYKLADLPSIPHPNCMCSVRPITKDFDKFTDDLSRWASGEEVEYLDTWYATQYHS